MPYATSTTFQDIYPALLNTAAQGANLIASIMAKGLQTIICSWPKTMDTLAQGAQLIEPIARIGFHGILHFLNLAGLLVAGALHLFYSTLGIGFGAAAVPVLQQAISIASSALLVPLSIAAVLEKAITAWVADPRAMILITYTAVALVGLFCTLMVMSVIYWLCSLAVSPPFCLVTLFVLLVSHYSGFFGRRGLGGV